MNSLKEFPQDLKKIAGWKKSVCLPHTSVQRSRVQLRRQARFQGTTVHKENPSAFAAVLGDPTRRHFPAGGRGCSPAAPSDEAPAASTSWPRS